MFEITIHVNCPDLVQAVGTLAQLLDRGGEPPQAAAEAPNTPEVTAAPSTPAPAETPAEPTVAQSAVPVAPAPAYTKAEISKAGADMLASDKNNLPTLMALLEKFSVRAINDLKDDQLGAFATELRALGANI